MPSSLIGGANPGHGLMEQKMVREVQGSAIVKETPRAILLTGVPKNLRESGNVEIHAYGAASAVAAFAKHDFSTGFRLMMAFEVAVRPEVGSCLRFYEEKKDKALYIFAERMTTREELRTNPALKSEWDRVLYVLPSWNGMPLYLDSSKTVQHVAGENYMNTVLIGRDGREIWRAPESQSDLARSFT
jgi:hypothetical protein